MSDYPQTWTRTAGFSRQLLAQKTRKNTSFSLNFGSFSLKNGVLFNEKGSLLNENGQFLNENAVFLNESTPKFNEIAFFFVK